MAIKGFEITFSDKIPAPVRRNVILKILAVKGVEIEEVDSPIIQKGGGTSKTVAFSMDNISIMALVEIAIRECEEVVVKKYTPKIRSREEIFFN